MQYIILIYGSETAWNHLTEPDKAELAQAHAAITQELKAAGEFIVSSEVDETEAKVVRMHQQEVQVTDGPFSEGEQIVSGYYIVNCSNMARAVAVASRFAEVKFAPIEVRRLSDGSSWPDVT